MTRRIHRLACFFIVAVAKERPHGRILGPCFASEWLDESCLGRRADLGLKDHTTARG